MKKLWSWLKKLFKRILPPTIHIFQREIRQVQTAMAAREANLSLQIGETKNETRMQADRLDRLQAKRLDEIEQRQGKRLDRLYELFASANRENLRLFFDAREERRAMDERYAQLSGQYEALTREIVGLRERQAELEKRLVADNAALTDGQQKLQTALRSVESSIPNKPVLWSNQFERSVVTANWGDVSEMPDYADKFLRLTSGMDEKSVRQIIRILSRQKKYLNSESKRIDLFTREEQEEMRLLKENFTDEILELSGDLFAYRNYLLPINHFESSVFYYKHGIPELKTAERVKGKTIADIGGFIGDSVLVLSELQPGRIFTFEAEPGNYALLQRTMELNHVQNVTAENVALGAEAGVVPMHVGGSGSTIIDRPGPEYTGEIAVPVIRFDDYVEEHDIRDIALIKVDIEGGEPGFLAGAKKTICEQRPILLLSIYHNAHDFFELKPLIESWGLGYQFKIHKPTYGNATSETLLLAEPGISF